MEFSLQMSLPDKVNKNVVILLTGDEEHNQLILQGAAEQIKQF
jgi:hypothetical protein